MSNTDANLPPRESGDGKEVENDQVPAAPPPTPANPNTAQAAAAKGWSVDEKLLSEIESLGFTRICGEKALFYTGNKSADAAVGWILDHPEAQTDQTPLDSEGYSGGESSSSTSSPDEMFAASLANSYKMVFVVNNSLKMGLGKVAAQVAHATLGLYRELLNRPTFVQVLDDWTEVGETKVVLRGEDSDQLLQLQQKARSAGLHSYLVQDAGRTQIAAGSMTVLSVFGASDKVDEITGQLKLI